MLTADPFQGHAYGHNPTYDHLEDMDDGHPFTYDVLAVLILVSFKLPINLE